jgi:N-dimethylarginine dimethylaminohydrolase
MTSLERVTYGGQNMVGRLRRALVRAPTAKASARWKEFGWRSEPDPVRLVEEHQALCEMLQQFGVEVVIGEASDGDLDAIYTHDPVLICDSGAMLLRPGKEIRRREIAKIAADLATVSIPEFFRLEAPATAEAGDLVWLDERTLLVGRGYRTNAAGIVALDEGLPEVEVIPLDLANYRGPGEVFHLMSFMSLLDWDLVLVYPMLAPVRLLELFSDRQMRVVEVPDKEFESLGANVLALAPSVALAAEGNPITRRRLEKAGVEVSVCPSTELGKGDGGPTCLTRPLLRDCQRDELDA